MTAVAASVRRARRMARIFQEVHGRTGSVPAALAYTARYTLSKLPRLLRGLGQSGAGTRAAAEQIQMARATIAANTALVGVLASGGIGDYIVVARFLRDLAREAGPLAIDIFANSPAPAGWVFASVPGVRTVRDDFGFAELAPAYDVALRLNQVATVAGMDPAALRAHPALGEVIARLERARPGLQPFIDRHPNWDNFLAQTAVFANRTRADALHGMAGLGYGGDALEIAVDDGVAARHGLARGGYVTIHNGYDPQFFVRNHRATKCYPHFDVVVARLRQRFLALPIVQLGTNTSEPIAGVDLNLIGATSLREAAGVLAGAALHIDNEGGLVHLARCLGVASCVVFGPTPANYFGYHGNLNITPNFCGGCWWMTETWMDHCPRGFAQPRCLSEQDPAGVAEAIGQFLAR